MILLSNVIHEFFAVLVTGMVLGAGVPTLYGFGIRLLAWGEGAQRNGDEHPVGVWAGYAIFVLVGIIVVCGVAVIIASGLGYGPGSAD